MTGQLGRRAERKLARRLSAGLAISMVLVAGAGIVRQSLAAVGAAPAHVSGAGAIGTGGSTQAVSIDAQTFSEGVATFALTEGDPSTSPPAVSGTVTCVANWGGVVSVGVIMSDGREGVIAISDGAATGDPDTLRIDFALGGPDCTASYPPGTPLSTGDLTIGPLACLAGPPPGSSTVDANGDLIADVLQPAGSALGAFCDGSTAVPTSGSVYDGAALTYFVQDAADAATGVLATVESEAGPGPSGPAPSGPDGTPGPSAEPSPAYARFLVCGFIVSVDAGSAATLTCASIRVSVLVGQAAISLGDDASVEVPVGGTAEVTRNADGSFDVANVDPDGEPIALVVGGQATSIEPGGQVVANAWTFVGFSQPVENEPVVNVVTAGQAVPLRWRVVDAAGVGVTTITAAAVTSTVFDCTSGATFDVVQETASGGSGLRHLGNGFYELNWKSSRSYAGTCRTLHIAYGDGVAHDALFRFAP